MSALDNVVDLSYCRNPDLIENQEAKSELATLRKERDELRETLKLIEAKAAFALDTKSAAFERDRLLTLLAIYELSYETLEVKP